MPTTLSVDLLQRVASAVCPGRPAGKPPSASA